MIIYADGNVPFDPAGHLQFISLEPIWLIQQMAASTNFDGAPPQTIACVIAPITIGGGFAKADALIHGGIFTFQAIGRAIIVEEYYAKNATFTFVINTAIGTTRLMPTAEEFILAAGETITVTSTGATPAKAEVGFLVRLHGSRGV
jgi:hypothetical protein